jgi:hypothetical protein
MRWCPSFVGREEGAGAGLGSGCEDSEAENQAAEENRTGDCGGAKGKHMRLLSFGKQKLRSRAPIFFFQFSLSRVVLMNDQ